MNTVSLSQARLIAGSGGSEVSRLRPFGPECSLFIVVSMKIQDFFFTVVMQLEQNVEASPEVYKVLKKRN